MNTFQKALFIFAVGVMLSAGCNNSTADHTTDASQEVNAADTSKLDGPWKEYKDSVLVARGSYKNGKQVGTWTFWYPNGQIREEGHFRKGKKDGIWVQWYKDGDVMWKGVWELGKQIINPLEAEPEVEFLNVTPKGGVLTSDSVYEMQIRIPNVPPDFLFVEVSSGTINRGEEPDQFIYRPSSDSSTTLLIGYYPDKAFKDFRNLVSEIKFTIVQ